MGLPELETNHYSVGAFVAAVVELEGPTVVKITPGVEYQNRRNKTSTTMLFLHIASESVPALINFPRMPKTESCTLCTCHIWPTYK